MASRFRTTLQRTGMIGAVCGLSLLSAAGLPGSAFADPGSSQGNGGHNPPGNNGTVKIHDTGDMPTDVRDVPHVSCNWWVDFYGFDKSQSVTVVYTAQPPSGSQEIWRSNQTVISTTDAGGAANDFDFQWPFTADPGSTSGATKIDLSGLTQQQQQGYHVKLTVLTGQPGDNGVKHKVFWVEPCQTSTPPGGGGHGGGGQGGGGQGGGGQGGGGQTTAPGGTTTTGATGGAVTGAGGAAQVPTQVPTRVLGESFHRGVRTGATTSVTTAGGGTTAGGATGAQVLGASGTPTLPFTGAPTGKLLGAAGSTLAIGIAMLVAGRRRESEPTKA